MKSSVNIWKDRVPGVIETTLIDPRVVGLAKEGIMLDLGLSFFSGKKRRNLIYEENLRGEKSVIFQMHRELFPNDISCYSSMLVHLDNEEGWKLVTTILNIGLLYGSPSCPTKVFSQYLPSNTIDVLHFNKVRIALVVLDNQGDVWILDSFLNYLNEPLPLYKISLPKDIRISRMNFGNKHSVILYTESSLPILMLIKQDYRTPVTDEERDYYISPYTIQDGNEGLIKIEEEGREGREEEKLYEFYFFSNKEPAMRLEKDLVLDNNFTLYSKGNFVAGNIAEFRIIEFRGSDRSLSANDIIYLLVIDREGRLWVVNSSRWGGKPVSFPKLVGDGFSFSPPPRISVKSARKY